MQLIYLHFVRIRPSNIFVAVVVEPSTYRLFGIRSILRIFGTRTINIVRVSKFVMKAERSIIIPSRVIVVVSFWDEFR